MASMRRWVHDRTVIAAPSGSTEVIDVVTFSPRWALVPIGPVLRSVLAAFFRHRHRRLARYFTRGDCQPQYRQWKREDGWKWSQCRC